MEDRTPQIRLQDMRVHSPCLPGLARPTLQLVGPGSSNVNSRQLKERALSSAFRNSREHEQGLIYKQGNMMVPHVSYS